MKFSAVCLATVVFAQDDGEKKVPPRHPLQRLKTLTEFSDELMNDAFTFLPSKNAWVGKFARNAARMERNFIRGNLKCGFYDQSILHGGPVERKRRDIENDLSEVMNHLRYDTADPSAGVKQITTGFSKWAVRYIAECSGQRYNQFQVNRMATWNDKLQAHLVAHSSSA